MRFIDTNIILRYLVKPKTPADDTKHHACLALFQRVRAGTEQVTTCEAVVTEVLYNLCSPRQYNLSHAEAVARVRPLLALRHLHLPQKRVYLQALELFSVSPALDIEDAIIVAHMEQRRLKELLSYDTDFDPITGILRQEP